MEDCVESSGFGLTNHLHEILSAIVDRRCTIFGQDGVFSLGRDRIHREVSKPAELQERCPDPATRAESSKRRAANLVFFDGTPIFFFNGHAISGAVGLADFKKLIDARLARLR